MRLTQGPPGLNLPDLNVARRTNFGVPKIAPPASAASAPKAGLSATAPLSMQFDNWPMALIDQRNRVGAPGEDLLSRNFNWGAPIVSLPGRAGMDLNLGLSLNSLVWTRSGTNIHFDLDKGSPSPGFRLGLPELGAIFYNTETGTESRIVIMPSGQRYEFRLNPAYSPDVVYEEMGSTHMLLTLKTNPFNTLDKTWTLLLTDGTAYKFRIIANNPKCVEVKDRNGNYISVAYNGFEQINTITDPLGRIVTFNYDGSNRLTSITQNWAGGTHTYATFAYDNVTIQTFFPELTMVGVANGATIPVLSRVTMADGKVYAFEYNSYAQVKTIKCYAPNSENPGDFPDDYTLLSYISYDLERAVNEPQWDCPRFSSRRDWAKDWNDEDEAITIYAGDGATWGEVTTPDGTTYKEIFGASGWQRGLTLRTETWSNGSLKKWTTSTWVNGDPNVSYWLNPRVGETNVHDENNNRKKTKIDYADFGAVSDIREYDANASTVLRHTQFEYLRGTAYTGNLKRRLTQLVTSQTIKDGNGALQSKVTYEYDLGGGYLVHEGTPIKHDTTNFGLSFVQGRGNLNVVRRWDVTAPNDDNKSVVSMVGYNTSGSVIFSRDPLGHGPSMSYTDSFSDSVNRNTFAYPTTTTVTDPEPHSSTAQYNYDFGAVTRAQDPKGAAVITTYDPIGRIERVTNQVNQAYTRYVYAPDHLSVQSFTTVNDLSSEFYRITVVDGHGRARGVASEHPGSVGGYKAQSYEYDIMGRPTRQSNPTETYANWVPAGDDAAGRAWSSQTYDWQGRPTVSTNQDGVTRSIGYEGCGCAGGQKVVLIDEVGRRREQNFDILGRMWRERTYSWGGSNESGIYSTTTNTYNVRDQVTNVNALDNTTGVAQNTVMTYDGHGRLKEKWLPIFLGNPQSATPYMSYEYYDDDALKKVTDPRGASSTQVYNNRHLVTGVTYGSPSGVAATPNVTFAYDEAGNRTLMDDGPGMVTYTYDTQSRLINETRVFDSISRYKYQGSGQPYQNTFPIGYQYNLAGGLKQIQTPTGDVIDYSHDKAGMLIRVSGTPRDGVTDYITDIKYRAWGGAKRVSYGYSNYAIDTQFNGRMLISRIDDQNQHGFGVTYNYNPDGRLGAVQGIYAYGRTMDRSFSYDHLGRVLQTRSGSAAGLDSDEPEQLKQNYAYDAFSHMTSRSGRYWYIDPSNDSAFTATYINGRGMNVIDKGSAQNWQYDVAGNIKSFYNTGTFFVESDDLDAAGRVAKKSHSYSPEAGGATVSVEDFEYDGNGNLVSKTKGPHSGVAEYYVKSSVLSKTLLGISIRWFLLNGQYLIAYTQRQLAIYVGSEEIATRNYETVDPANGNKVIWQHRDPHNTIANIGNSASRTLYSTDPLGTLVKTASQGEFDAYWNPPGGGGATTPPPEGFYQDYSTWANGYTSPFPGGWGMDCQYDGVQRPCGEVLNALSNGSGKIDTGRMPTWNSLPLGIAFLDEGNGGSTEDFTTTKDHPDRWVDGVYIGGGDIFGGSRLNVKVSSLFAPQTKQPTPTPYTVQNNIPVFMEFAMGAENVKYMLLRDDEIAKKCKNAIASASNPDPIATRNAILRNKVKLHPDTIYRDQSGPRPGTVATTVGLGENARTEIFARYWSLRDGVSIIVDGKPVKLSLYEYQALVWFHEVSHGTGKYTHDDHPSFEIRNISNDGLNEIIYKNCLQGAKLLPQPPPPKNCKVCK